MKKLYFWRAVKFLILLVPIAACVLFAQEYLFYYSGSDTENIRAFYREPENSLDFVVVGASEITTGFSPVYGYQYSGLTSALYGFGNNPAPLYRYELEEILSKQKPQMIVIEIQGFLCNDIDQRQEVLIRKFSENIPRSANWWNAIWNYPFEDKLSCWMPFFKYHSQWQMTPAEMKERFMERSQKDIPPSRMKGIKTTAYTSAITSNYEIVDDETVHDLDPIAQKALIELLEYCRAEKMENILFVRFPHQITGIVEYDRFARSNRVGQIVEEYGYPFLNMEKLRYDIGFETMYDFSDPEHLGLYGQIKLTEYLCDYLQDEYAIVPMEKSAECVEMWDKCIPYVEAFYEIASEDLEFENGKILYENDKVIAEIEERIKLWDEAEN